ncbi:hypothetical protein T552_02894 [Pneumocystis carinii B80]|uniref:Kinesin-like protein n=1 Tax=Pneumocystis carinii (strain B80) TaxID=1408658 RepID=A0A0W4ZDE7_PNEC8|nr:hypothetical protein T552_02894 [Pneumocystis carinii B80]KTW26413.1 hypothetical protein T552_02894 [Pneumocystis carinii B80]
MASNHVKVVCRFRPLNKYERSLGNGSLVVCCDTSTVEINTKELIGRFVFDRVFDGSTCQSELFEGTIKSTVDDVLKGYNGTIFAYGHTGSGKTYTMMGPNIDSESRGAIPRIVEYIFESIMKSQSFIEYMVKVSYMEIYMERIRDLLCPQHDHLPIHEEKNRGVYVKGLKEVYVSSLDEVYQIIKKGNQVRVAAATNVNPESSRSHAIFCITVMQKNLETENTKSGQLFLIDLAGSEKVAKTGASGQTLEEAKKINKSLSTLGLVINSLTDGKSTHIPYRDSKLTRILQESLGGNSRTTLIINCSPSAFDEQETLSTIRFGIRAKNIKNRARINQELSLNELKFQLKKATTQLLTCSEYITALENELDIWRGGERVHEGKWTPKMIIDVTPQSKIVLNNEKDNIAESDMLEKKSVPFIQNSIMEKDERDGFLKREIELQDMIIEKETLLNNREKVLKDAKEEILYLKEQNNETVKINEELTTKVNDLQLELEKITFENKEAYITLDSLKYTNESLVSELNDMRQSLFEAKTAMESIVDHKSLKKKTKQIIEESDFPANKINSSKQFLDDLNNFNEITINSTKILNDRLTEMQSVISSLEIALNDRMNEADNLKKNNSKLEHRLKYVEDEYQFLIDKLLFKENEQYIKVHEILFNQSCNLQVYNGLLQVNNSDEVPSKLSKDVSSKSFNEKPFTKKEFDISDNNNVVNSSAPKTEELGLMKKSLIKEFQERRDKVVDLEISLNEIREQYTNILRNNNVKNQRKKMLCLEKNLEQLIVIQKQLVEQNTSLKRDISIAERKLVVRNERISSLETLLCDAQGKLISQNRAFEKQIQILKERLERIRGKTRKLLPK